MLVFFCVGICKYFLEHARHCLSRNVNVTHEQGTKTKAQLNRTRVKNSQREKSLFQADKEVNGIFQDPGFSCCESNLGFNKSVTLIC